MFWDVESTKEIMVAAEVRNVEWNTYTATQVGLSFDVQPLRECLRE